MTKIEEKPDEHSQPAFTLHTAETLMITRRTVIDIIDDGLFLYRQDYAVFLGAVSMIYLPYYVLKYLAFLLDLLPFQRIFDSFDFFHTGSYTVTNILFMGFDYTIMVMAAGLVTLIIYEKAGSKDVRFRTVIKKWFQRLPRLIFYSWVLTLFIGGGFSCFFPGFFLFLSRDHFICFVFSVNTGNHDRENHSFFSTVKAMPQSYAKRLVPIDRFFIINDRLTGDPGFIADLSGIRHL
jgi:hypothetical protein